YRGDAGPARSSNRFDVERVYLTFRMPAGERTSIRVTTDLFQQTTPGNDSYYRGWTVRAKYAYLQYNYLNGPDWKANARVGLLHTVFIDHDEQFWPRWVALSPTDRAAYFSSADAGIATTLSFPNKLGELYATITNGPGYTSRETDRFKDYAARVTVTPWAANSMSLLKAVALSGWIYRGATASKFVDGGTGQVGRVGSALDRNRWGMHVGRIDPRFTFGAEYASRQEQGELGSNTVASPRSVIDSTGTLVSGYGVVRPFNGEAGKPHPLSLIARYDRVTTNTDKDSRYNVFIGGAAWDLSSKASMSLDYQANEPVSGSPIARSHTWFAHFVARF
ncbi:MAG TPA: hypothetical protein VKO87_10800, partial [Gemmatimonadaceae bacterium]|nr:hypothetical protein [Gemmatimonadaceae bacterium]